MPRLTYSKRDAIRQAVAMQKLCFSGAELLAQDIQASTNKEQRARVATGLGNLVKGWRVLEEAKRILKGDPMPGCLKPTERQPRKRKQPTPEEVAESMGLLAKQSAVTEPDKPNIG